MERLTPEGYRKLQEDAKRKEKQAKRAERGRR